MLGKVPGSLMPGLEAMYGYHVLSWTKCTPPTIVYKLKDLTPRARYAEPALVITPTGWWAVTEPPGLARDPHT